MGFRQNNKRKAEQGAAFAAWKERNRERIAAAGLPVSVLATRDDWAYFVRYGYHDHGNWNTPPGTWIDFTGDELTETQRPVVAELESDWTETVKREPILAERLTSQSTT
jgi:hypothetical protein